MADDLTASRRGSSHGEQELWIQRKHGLRYVLGEFRLFSWSFPALVLERHHTELPDRLEAVPIPLERLSRKAEAAVVPSFTSRDNLRTLLVQKRFIRYLPERVSHHWIELSGTHESYLKQLSSKERRELRRKMQNLSNHLKEALVFREYRRPDEMATFHRLALEVSQKTYQERLLHAGLPATEAFARDLESKAASDRVRGYLLLDGEKPIAYGYCEAQGPVLMYVNTGYDPEYRNWSPGIVLFGRMLERLFAEGTFGILDFDYGDARWKSSYATQTALGGRVLFFRSTLRNLAMVVGHIALNETSRLAVSTLASLKIKDALKRRFRGTGN